MHRAPSVNYSVKRSRWQLRLIVCVILLALATLSVFVMGQEALDARTGAVGSILLGAMVTALLGWKQSPQGTLRWDGNHWYWSGFPENLQCRLTLMMDCQGFVIVAIKSEVAVAIFLWLEKCPSGANWKPLRRAIVSSQIPSNSSDKQSEPIPHGELA